MLKLLLLTLSLSRVGADKLDIALASAIFPATSTMCNGAGSSTSFSATYTSTMDVSDWNVNNALYEEDVFEVDMFHSDANANRTWALRLGKGGQIASFRVASGEAIANQASSHAVWNDLVQQMVAVNLKLNTGADPNFIHQAGPYMKDTGMPPPFYSPNVALDCSGNECSTINWGQQAHVPTHHDSPLLYYTRYRDCGDGIIEYDMAMHHFGQVTTDLYKYFNTPWTGVRTSTFRDMMISNQNGELEHQFPMGGWGAGEGLRNLDTTGGFTTFAEDLELSSDVYDIGFCVDTTKNITEEASAVANTACNATNPDIVPFVFKVREGGINAGQTGHSNNLGLDYTVALNLCNLAAPVRLGANGWGNPYDGVLLTNDRSGFTFQSQHIIHFCWSDNRSYLDSNVTAAVLNEQFLVGDTISIKYVTSGKRIDDQLAMTFVHGENQEFFSEQSFYRAKSRLRFGMTNNKRDGTVWTTNLIGTLRPTETYFSRKYMITDSLQNMEAAASPLSEETFEDVAKINELESGQPIKLWMDSDSSFGASIGSDSCDHPAETLACTGSSTPKSGFRPWFYITCGSERTTSVNPYHFAVFDQETPSNKKPYLCVDESESTRADWKLLGYFDADCDDIGSREYQSDFCPGPSEMPSQVPSEATSQVPSEATSQVPSSAPSSQPSTSPSETPSVSPSLIPSVAPSNSPSVVPSSIPSSTPSEMPSISPSEATSQVPSSAPSSQPSTSPSETPSVSPSLMPSSVPSSTPSEMPSISPSKATSQVPSSAPVSAPVSAAPVAACVDSADWFWMRKNRTCQWVSKKPNRGLCNKKSLDGISAKEACPVACGTCPE